jgi:hypothetical protein
VEKVRLRLTFLCTWLLLATVTATSEESPAKVVHLDQMCGDLSFVTPISGGGMDSRPLSKVNLEIYLREKGITCCRNSRPFFTTITGKEGAFEFKNVGAGRYWLVTHYQRKTFQLAIAFDPESRIPASPACWQQQFDIDAKGHLVIGIRSEM